MPEVSLSRGSVFVDRLQALRADRGWSQTHLAKQMRERGFPFHQQTIQRIEDHRRSVRLDEAYALAEVLGSTVEAMSSSPQETDLTLARVLLRNASAAQHEAAWTTVPTMITNWRALQDFLQGASLPDVDEALAIRAYAGLTLEELIADIRFVAEAVAAAKDKDQDPEGTVAAAARQSRRRKARFELQQDGTGAWHFLLKGANGEIILASAAAYESKAAAHLGIAAVLKNASEAAGEAAAARVSQELHATQA